MENGKIAKYTRVNYIFSDLIIVCYRVRILNSIVKYLFRCKTEEIKFPQKNEVKKLLMYSIQEQFAGKLSQIKLQ